MNIFKQVKSFFENIESNPLTESQIKASLIDEKNKEVKTNKPQDMNSLLVRKPNVPVTVKKKDDKKYTQISEYKPTGNLIYNTALLKKIENNNK